MLSHITSAPASANGFFVSCGWTAAHPDAALFGACEAARVALAANVAANEYRGAVRGEAAENAAEGECELCGAALDLRVDAVTAIEPRTAEGFAAVAALMLDIAEPYQRDEDGFCTDIMAAMLPRELLHATLRRLTGKPLYGPD